MTWKGRTSNSIVSLPLASAVLAMAILVLAVFSGTAAAQVDVWKEIPRKGNLGGYAIIDHVSGSATSYTRTATGRVELILGDSSAIGRIQYAPFADFALDGRWNSLPTYRGAGRVVIPWSDTFHFSYEGFKFRICGAHSCSSHQSYIYF